jgi:hypothetical protein
MLHFDVRGFALVQRRHDLVPEHARLHDVALLHRCDLVAPLARELERDPADALDLVGVVDLRVDAALLPVAEVGDGFGLAEIHPAGELAQDDDVEPFDHIALEARGFGERRVAHGRADVGEQIEVFAQPQEAGLGSLVVGVLVPFRPADRAEDHGVRRLRLLDRLVGHGDAVSVVAGAADQPLLGVEAAHAVRVHPIDQALHFGHHLLADAVAGEEQQFVGRHESYASRYGEFAPRVLEGRAAIGKAPGLLGQIRPWRMM